MTFPNNILTRSFSLIALIIIAAVIIFYQFPSIPQNISFDEAEFTKLALSLDNKPYAPYSTLATGHTTLYFYLILASIKIFGITPFALRLPSALFGLLGVISMYFVMRNIFTKEYLHEKTKSAFLTRHEYIIPTLLTFIFLSLRWYYNFARFSFEATFLLFLELTAVWFFFSYRNTKNIRWLLGSGLCAGLAYNSYTPGRLFFLLLLLFLISEFKSIKKIRSHIVTPFLMFMVPLLIVMAPVTWYLSAYPDIRINQLSYVTNDKMQLSEKITFAGDSISRAARMFHFDGDMNGRHNFPGKPALNPLIGFFFLVGLIYSLRNIRRYEHIFFLCYFALSMLPMMLTYPWESPNMLRSFTVIPSIIFFVGNAILLLYKLPLKHRYLTIGIFTIFTVGAIYDLRTYFVYMKILVFPEAFEINRLLFPAYIEGMYQWYYQFK